MTFPRSVRQLPPFEDYSMEGRTYRYSREEPLYPFGFGLSYTRFEYCDLKLEPDKIRAGKPLQFSFSLLNAGQVEADEVVQVYLSDLQASTRVPLTKLVAFKRVRLAAGQKKTVKITIGADKMAFIDAQGKTCLEPGEFRLSVGGCSPGKRGSELGAAKPLEFIFSVIQERK